MDKVYIASTYENIIAVYDHEPTDAEKEKCIRDNAMFGSMECVFFKEYDVISSI